MGYFRLGSIHSEVRDTKLLTCNGQKNIFSQMYDEGKEVLKYKCKSRILKTLNVCLGSLACMINQ